MVFYVDSQKSSSAEEIAFLLNKCILQYPGRWSELVFLCIGSDRVTGDCLGPYIGHQLLEHLNTDTHGVYVYGTLKSPARSKFCIPKVWLLQWMPPLDKKSTWGM